MSLVSKTFSEATALRRSRRALQSTIPVSDQQIVKLCENALLETPSAFDNQATRLTVLFGEDHQKLWSIVGDILKAKIGEERYEKGTSDRMAKFAQSHGTILFWDDLEAVENMRRNTPDIYKDKVDEWIYQANGMHQFYLWTGLAALGIGANLQHYNPLIDEKVQDTWKLPANWRLEAQMVFGGYDQPDEPKPQKFTLEQRLGAFGVQ